MRIKEFMGLKDEEKTKYMQLTYPAKDKSEVWDYDFGVFEDRECEICGLIAKVAYGTADSREPKFCQQCFIEGSEETDFVLTSEYHQNYQQEQQEA